VLNSELLSAELLIFQLETFIHSSSCPELLIQRVPGFSSNKDGSGTSKYNVLKSSEKGLAL